MEYICPNCKNEILDNFCGHCGQKRFKRIDRKYVVDEVKYTMFHINRGFLYSVKKILQNPGKVAREYINGDRVNHYKPILLLFVLSGISSFIGFKLIGLDKMMELYYSQQRLNSKALNDYLSFIAGHSSLVVLLLIPVFAFNTKIAFKKWGHNYHEHIIMNSYILSFYTILCILLFYPLMYWAKHDISRFMFFSNLSVLGIPAAMFWFYLEFYIDKPKKSVTGKVLKSIGLLILEYVLLVVVVLIIALIFGLTKGPEALKDF